MLRRPSIRRTTLAAVLALCAIDEQALAQSQGPTLAPMDRMPRDGQPIRPPAESARPPTDAWRPDNGAENSVRREDLPEPERVEQGDLAPVMAQDGSGLPHELWRGLDAPAFERLISDLEIPPRSPALHALWKRLIAANAAPPSGVGSNANFTAVRLEVLYQSGLAEDAAAELAKLQIADDPVLAALAARNEIALGRVEKGCELARRTVALKGQMPKWLKGQALLMSGYCAALADDKAGAGLAAEIARDEGVETSLGLEALDAFSIGAKVKIAPGKQISLLDYRIAEKAGGVPAKAALESGEPALLVALSNDPSTPADLGLLAAEAATRLNALSPDTLASIYRVNAGAESADALLSGGGAAQGPFRRATLFKAAETERAPASKARLVRVLVDEAKRAGVAFQTLVMLAPAVSQLTPQPEIGWFNETGAEISLAAGQYDAARRWIAASPSPGATEHWLALADIADANFAPRGRDLVAIEPLAASGRFPPDALHRLATVLDALLYQVPIPLWDAASRTPQPAGGHLPATGVLTELQDASKKQEFGRTVLLAMKALGANGAENAHMIALGDSIRALKRAGLEPDARRIGLEALLGAWPRSGR
ncbi:MAG: hypothetical protein ACT4OU_01745 [Hyphomicrobium sp.]